MSITKKFIQNQIENQSYEISLHADDERLADGLTLSQLELALLNCEIIEIYSDDPRGESCLALGFLSDETPVHVICGKNPLGGLILITVYIPMMPKWKDAYTRNQERRSNGEEI